MNVDFIYIVSSSKEDPMCFKDVYVFSWSQGLPVYLGLILDSQPSPVLGLQVYRLTAGAKKKFWIWENLRFWNRSWVSV